MIKAFLEKPLALLCNKVSPGSHTVPRLKGSFMNFILQNNNSTTTTTTTNIIILIIIIPQIVLELSIKTQIRDHNKIEGIDP